ncbi:hypothetical protein F8O02_05020 [Pseudoclavibacter caeni]|uniref:Uncharacterized protein n=1 Tax=Pseudoclavibacter caeni TaxID=908846 RepID=A0A7C8FTW0_9MICO|nr:hypothetical protein F8O02_05020 [Pseudoclavibacter caeni]
MHFSASRAPGWLMSSCSPSSCPGHEKFCWATALTEIACSVEASSASRVLTSHTAFWSVELTFNRAATR